PAGHLADPLQRAAQPAELIRRFVVQCAANDEAAGRKQIRRAVLLFRSSVVGGAGEPFEEYAHLLRRLLIAAALRNVDAATIRLGGLPRAAGLRKHPAEQFPGGRIIGVLGYSNLGVLDGPVELPFGRVARREREA